MKSYEKNNKLKYETKDSEEQLYQQIKEKAKKYFNNKDNVRRGVWTLCVKISSLLLLLGSSYYCLLHSHSFPYLLLSYLAFGSAFLVLGINIGHDAAHSCVT